MVAGQKPDTKCCRDSHVELVWPLRPEKGILILAPIAGKKRTKNDDTEQAEHANGTEPTLFDRTRRNYWQK